jgi:hypothetical protein
VISLVRKNCAKIAGLVLVACALGLASSVLASEPSSAVAFPRPLASYEAAPDATVWQILKERAAGEPVNLAAAIIFFLAIVHTFLAPMFLKLSHRFEHQHRERLAKSHKPNPGEREEVSFSAEIFHFLGEVEAIFGIWVVPLLLVIGATKGGQTARDYLGSGLNFTEPLFVVVIMTIAASRPILGFSEQLMGTFARLGRHSSAAWWLSILTIGPLLGSFITEPAAMTISALLLADRFYCHRPSSRLAYATLGLLFVNVSVGGTLTHFAAPPVLMVAGKWHWGTLHMLEHFGWKAGLGIVAANLLYLALFWKELKGLGARSIEPSLPLKPVPSREPVPAWITAVHILFLAWTVLNSHFPPLFIGGFLFYLAFTRATEHHQAELALRPALLVGFFLAGLVVHGGLQGWWIGPVLRRLNEVPLFFGAAALTAFNDNAAITYLASLVPDFGEEFKYAVVAGAVAGGGLTVIANAPNPAGQSILAKFFPDGVSPLRLFLGALAPTGLVIASFLIFR